MSLLSVGFMGICLLTEGAGEGASPKGWGFRPTDELEKLAGGRNRSQRASASGNTVRWG